MLTGSPISTVNVENLQGYDWCPGGPLRASGLL